MPLDSLRNHLIAHFENSRAWLDRLIQSLTEVELEIQVDELRGPLIWDLGHIAWFEEQWISRHAFEQQPLRRNADIYYDNERNHKRLRQTMPLLHGHELYDYMRSVRQKTLSHLADCNFDPGNKLLKKRLCFLLSPQS